MISQWTIWGDSHFIIVIQQEETPNKSDHPSSRGLPDRISYQASREDETIARRMAAPRALQSITIPATAKHTATVIFLHGLGDSGAGWAPVARLLSRNPNLQHIKWVLPHAPVQRVTLNMGMSMPSWFDIATLTFNNPAGDASAAAAAGIRGDRLEDQDGILNSAMAVGRLIAKEVDDEGIEAKRILLGGFSQGAALGLVTGLTSERRLAGLVCLSGWLPMSTKMKAVRRQSPYGDAERETHRWREWWFNGSF